MLCRRDFSEHSVSIFAHQIKYEYDGSNRSVSIEVIVLEHFCAADQNISSSSLHTRTFHAVFRPFMSDNRKQDGKTTAAQSKLIIDMLKIIECLGSGHSNIWYNTGGCYEYYRCVT